MAKDPQAQPFLGSTSQKTASGRSNYEESTAAHPSSQWDWKDEPSSLPYDETSAFMASTHPQTPNPPPSAPLAIGRIDETSAMPMLTEKNQIPPRVTPRPAEATAYGDDPYRRDIPYATLDPHAQPANYDPYSFEGVKTQIAHPDELHGKKPKVKKPKKPQSALKSEDDKPKKPQTLPLPILFFLVACVVTVLLVLFLRQQSLEDELKSDRGGADLPERLLKAARWRDAADVYRQRGQNREALVLYETNHAWQDAAQLLHQMKQHKQAAIYFEKADMHEMAAQAYEEAKIFPKAGDLYRRARRYEKALVMFERSKAWPEVATLFEQQKQWAKAAEAYEKAGVWAKAAELWFREKNYEKALAFYTKVQDYPQAGQAALYLSKVEEATQFFAKAKIEKCLGGIQHSLGQHKSAAQSLFQIAEKHPDYALLLLIARSAEQGGALKISKAALKLALAEAERFGQASKIVEVHEMQGKRRLGFLGLLGQASKALQKGEPWQAERFLRPLAQLDELSLNDQNALRKVQDGVQKAMLGKPRLLEVKRTRKTPIKPHEEKLEHEITITATLEAPADKTPPSLRLSCSLFQQDISPYLSDEVDNTEELSPLQACRFFRGSWKNFLALEKAPAGATVEHPLPSLPPGEKTTISFTASIPAPFRQIDCVLRPAAPHP